MPADDPHPLAPQSVADEVIDTARAMNALGINQGTAGNVSVRWGEGILITPTGMRYERLQCEDLVHVSWDGASHSPKGWSPSSEWRFHLDLIRSRSDLTAIVHTHGRAAAALSCLRRGLPPFHYMVALAGGKDVRCAPYATFGTQALSEHVCVAMTDRRACLLANHGLVTAGDSLAQALAIAVEVEALCDMYLRCLDVGEPTLLSPSEIQAALDRFAAGSGAGPAFGIERE